MELFIFRHAEYERLYNWTDFDIDKIPLEQRQFVPESIGCVLCAIYHELIGSITVWLANLMLYVPCIYSIWKHLCDNSCYKVLFYIGVTDLAIMWILGFFAAWLNLRGAVFCSYPTLNYLVGIGVTALWMAESSSDLIASPNFAHNVFSGHRILLWLFACSLYAMYWGVFLKPGIWSSVYFGWFFDPFVGYRSDDRHEFEQPLHPYHNIAVAVLSPSIYLVFVAKLFADVRASRQRFGVVLAEMNAIQKRVCVCVCAKFGC
ncbi:hypothetical protein niasHT_017920 [Heterodera trifolii]|uniref:Uncharacterized protein n=1 Tax=Heterodera trifolii TaxID=157864 RepID=A0ABD2LJ07_9BILA